MPLSFSEYQDKAMTTAKYPDLVRVVYTALGLAGEAGEVANKVKKVLRDGDGVFTDGNRESISQEIGDCLWYAAALASDLGLDLEAIAQQNLDKLESRKTRGVIGGSGDLR